MRAITFACALTLLAVGCVCTRGPDAPPPPTCTSGKVDPNYNPATCKSESHKELCWDGVDNDCNGCIDEGCPPAPAASH